MNKSQAMWLSVVGLFACAAAYSSRESDKAGTLSDTRITSTAPIRIGVDTVSTYIRTAIAETKIMRDLMKKWNDDSNAATNLDQLKQVAIDEGPSGKTNFKKTRNYKREGSVRGVSGVLERLRIKRLNAQVHLKTAGRATAVRNRNSA